MYIQKLIYIETAAFIYMCCCSKQKTEAQEKKKIPNPFSPFGSLLFACFLMKKQTEVIRLQTD
jgi:hypothetical protein